MRQDAPVFHLVPASSLFKVSSSPSLPEGVMNPSQPIEPQVAAAEQALLRMEAGNISPIPNLVDQSITIGAGKQKKKSPKRKSPSSSKKRKSSSKKPATKRSPAKKTTSKSSATKKNKKSASKKKK